MGRSIRSTCLAWILTLAVGGCGDDGPSSPGELTPVSLQNGTWSIRSTTTLMGTDTRCQDKTPIVLEQQQVLCGATSQDIGDLSSIGTDGMECTGTSEGNTFVISCSGSVFLDPCTFDYTVWGSGKSTSTTYDVIMNYVFDVTGPVTECLGFVRPCTTRVEVEAAWIAVGVCSPLGPEGVPPARTLDHALEMFLGRD